MQPLWRLSASVILARPAAVGSGFEICLVKRVSSARIFPGMYVFPGGVYDEADGSLEVCALREVYEETGLFIPFLNDKIRVLNKWIPSREVVAKNASIFVECLRRLGLLDYQLTRFGEFKTPVSEAQRTGRGFTTQFYISMINRISDGSPCMEETTDLKWLSIASALNDFGSLLPPPQLYMLNLLKRVQNFDEIPPESLIISESYLRYPIQPVFIDRKVFVFPGDYRHPSKLRRPSNMKFIHFGVFGSPDMEISPKLREIIESCDEWIETSKL